MHPAMLDQIAAEAQWLREQYPDLDEGTFADTLEGQTDVMEIAGAILKADAEALADADRNAALAKLYSERASMLTARSKALRASLARLMDAASLTKLKHAFGTVSISAGREKLELAADFTPPQGYGRVRVEPDKDAIKRALQAGETMPGAALVTGDPVLTIRRS